MNYPGKWKKLESASAPPGTRESIIPAMLRKPRKIEVTFGDSKYAPRFVFRTTGFKEAFKSVQEYYEW